SRRRHTRFSRDWSSDVCSSDLVASEKVTVVDHGTMPSKRGSINVDDEGSPTQHTTLIENGILKGYISDKLSARLMGIANTGNGRSEERRVGKDWRRAGERWTCR